MWIHRFCTKSYASLPESITDVRDLARKTESNFLRQHEFKPGNIAVYPDTNQVTFGDGITEEQYLSIKEMTQNCLRAFVR